MAITLDGTSGITTPDVNSDGLTVDTTTLVVDEANNRVGIGTSSPASKLDISTGGSTGTTDMVTLSGLDAGSAKQTYGVIRMGIENNTAGAEQGNLHFQTAEAGTVRDRIYLNGSGYMTFSNGGSERMRIDSAGRVTMPYQPMCWVVLNGTTTTAGTAFTTNSLNTNAGNCWNSSTHRFTAPVTGYYHCTAGLYTNYTSSFGYWAFFKNGGSIGSYHFNHGGYVIHEGMGATAIIYCVAGDYIQMGRAGTGNGYFDRVDLSVFLCG